MDTTQRNSANNPHADTTAGGGRRKFLTRLWAVLGALGFIEFGWLTGSILSSKKKQKSDIKTSILTVGQVDSFSPDSVTAVPEGQFYLARLKDGSFLALSHTCTHLGCSLPWDEKTHRFICPCHGSSFDICGEVLTPPATRGLNSYPLRIENGIIRVNITTSQKHLKNGTPRSVQA
ncbi:MAG: Rieske (2Fe-2S) protein [Desulforhopalus sp.]